ncbi:hypothetical protein ACX06_18965 [Vibrio parahaemolyticus]|uniref:DUF4433 domain-containing protein n=2 Tax=Vibrionaceae TaxID=641 RepID=A0AAW3IUM5_VIBPH|nr:hypothetical protein [Vibrio parahaemolyticus]KOY21380.1 hypothetical protein ACX06_18965 [Vibrio parahaemolyticus]KOY28117.1 hypothetical protein ACX05_18985 [Vibrio parahaemolyticus]
MLLYHFTEKRLIDQILKDGIKTGVVPYNDGTGFSFVSLTGRLSPEGHGLLQGEKVTECHPEFNYVSSKFPDFVQNDETVKYIQLPDKTEAVIEVNIPDTDPKLITLEQFIVNTLKKLGLNSNIEIVTKLKADCIVTGRFPLGQEHLTKEEIADYTREELSNPSDESLQWYFY